jgi:hypothetical protein
MGRMIEAKRPDSNQEIRENRSSCLVAAMNAKGVFQHLRRLKAAFAGNAALKKRHSSLTPRRLQRAG